MDQLLFWEYAGLFSLSFLAATILPFSSEALLILMVRQSGQWLMPVVIASAGNILGAYVNYLLGYAGERWIDKRWNTQQDKSWLRVRKIYRRYGKYSLLFSWLPIIGDPLTVIAGLFKTTIVTFFFFVSLGKTGRYLTLALGAHALWP